MHYIRSVRVSAPGTHNEHITHVGYAASTTGPLTTATRAVMAAHIDGGGQVRTHNPSTGTQAPVVTRTSSRGIHYLTTVANGRETDNLLRLPRF